MSNSLSSYLGMLKANVRTYVDAGKLESTNADGSKSEKFFINISSFGISAATVNTVSSQCLPSPLPPPLPVSLCSLTLARLWLSIAPPLNVNHFPFSFFLESTKAFGGPLTYTMHTLYHTFQYTQKPVRFSLDNRAVETLNVYLFAVANGKYFGGGMKVAPDAVLDDGEFSVITFEDVSVMQVPRPFLSFR